MPPDAETLSRPNALPEGSNTITPAAFQVPPRPLGASQSVIGGPPAASIFFSLLPAKNPIHRLSGDQNGWLASVVPASGCAVNASSGRSQSCELPSAALTLNVMRRPSGESATGPVDESPPVKLNVVLSGGGI